MKRLFWLGVGLAAGAYLTRRATEAAQNLTAAGVGANLADGLRELGAGLGAFGAHGLKKTLAADMLAVYQTGVQYHFYHVFAILFLST